MPRKTTPKDRLHKARNWAVVTLGGRDHYLGAYGSPESWELYHRLVAEHLSHSHRHRADRPLLAVREDLLRQGRQAAERALGHQARPPVRPPAVRLHARRRVHAEEAQG